MDIPASIMSHYRDIALVGDIIFVNTIPFFVMISRHMKFGTAEMINNQKSPAILVAIKQVKAIYMRRGFNLTQLLMDGQFEPQRAEVAEMRITLNTVSADEHTCPRHRAQHSYPKRTSSLYQSSILL
jgi:hypothetical protein